MRWRPHPPDHALMLSAERALPPWRQRRVDAHIEGCAICRRRSDAMRADTAEALLAFVGDDVRASGVSEARLRLERALQSAADDHPLEPRRVPAPGGLALAAAAIVAVALATWLGTGAFTRPAPSLEVSLSPLPATHLTPGAVSTLTADELCAGARTSRVVPDRVRRQVLAAYGMEHAPAATYELDALITRELGGTAELANLWPQPYHAPVWNARVKDALEDHLARAVCAGTMPLRDAQHAIASDWVGAYQRSFQTLRPLPAHVDTTEVDDDLLVEQSQQVRLVTLLFLRSAARQ